MDGIHDLGGKYGYGSVHAPADAPVFAARWEASVYAMMRCLGAAGVFQNTDQFRHAVERIDPGAYLTHGYYGRWLGGLETLLIESGELQQSELNERAAALGAPLSDPIAACPAADPADVPLSTDATSSQRSVLTAPGFEVGERVLMQQHAVPGHTRLPAYARGCIGEILSYQGGWVFPDSNAHGEGEQPTHLYCVAFSGESLWGISAEPGVVVHLDLFEPYLDAASEVA